MTDTTRANKLPELTYPQISTLLKAIWSLPTPQTLVILGGPGNAKTTFCRTKAVQILADIKGCDPSEIAYIEFVAGQRAPEDVGGLALPAKAPDGAWHTSYSRSPVLCQIETALAQPGIKYCVFNTDEITQCEPDMQKALRGVLDADTRMIGGNPLPNNVYVIATGNRTADKAGSTRMLSHAANATIRCEVRFDVDSWAVWAKANKLNARGVAAAHLLTSEGFFVERVPAEDVQYCTARSYARFLQAADALSGGDPDVLISDSLELRLLGYATIGESATEQLLVTLRLLGKVPSPVAIQATPETAVVADQTHYQHAAAQVALATVQDAKSGDNALIYIDRLRDDIAISAGTKLLDNARQQKLLLTGPKAGEFVAKHADLLPLAEGVVI